MNTTPPDNRGPKLRDTGRLIHSLSGFVTPRPAPTSPSKLDLSKILEVIQDLDRKAESERLKIFNPDGLRVFTPSRPQRPFPGNAPGPKGAA